MMTKVDQKGYIAIHRSIEDNWLWLSEPFSRAQAWIDLLLIANHKENSFFVRGNRVNVRRGQVARSESGLATRWNWSRKKVRTFLEMLKKEQQIAQHKSSIINVIEILNYDSYQKGDNRMHNKRTTEEQQKATNNNENNDNNDNKKEVTKKRFKKPTVKEIKNYCDERLNQINPDKFFNYYEANGWKVGKNSMKDWKAAIRTWEGNDTKKQSKPTSTSREDEERAKIAAFYAKQEQNK